MKVKNQQTKKSSQFRNLIFGAYLVSFLLITTSTFSANLPTVQVDTIAKKAANGIGILGLVHPGIAVTDLDRALHFYIDQLGFKEAFRLNKADGKPLLLYLQISDDTFVELFPNVTRAAPQSPMIFHFGLVVKNLQQTLHALEARGYPMPADAYEQAAKLAIDGTNYFNIKDPDGNFIELSQFNQESLLIKSSKKLTKLVQSSETGATISSGITAKNDFPLKPFKSGQLRILLNGKTEQLSKFMAGTLDMAPGQVLGPETHSKEELIEIFTEGQGQVSLDGKVIGVNPGSVLYVDPQHTQTITNNGTTTLSYYWFEWTAK